MVGIFNTLIASSSSDSTEKPDKTTSDATEEVADTKTEKPKPNKNWKYSEGVDEMTDAKKKYFASCESTNSHDFKFPYKKNTHLTLYVRNMDEENDVYLY